MLELLAAGLVYVETLYPEWGQQMKMDKILHEEKTEWQDLCIFENSRFGKVLALDGVIQTTEADNDIYSEMMTHVPFLAHGHVKNVLIVGGGDGSILRQALCYKDLERAVVVDIDASVVSTTKEWMPNICGKAFDDVRAQVIIQDATQYVKECTEQFDVIICDSTDPFGPGEVLFTEEFYGNCKKLLTPGGIFVNQNGVPFLQKNELDLTLKNRSPYFKNVGFYVVAMPTYVGGFMAIGFATDATADLPSTAELAQRMRSIEGEMLYYTPQIHKAAFALPAFMER